LNAEEFAQIADAVKFDGVKLSGGAAAAVEEFAALLPATLPIYSGADADVFRVGEAGGAGIVSGISAAFPAEIAALVGAYSGSTEGDRAAAQARVDELSDITEGSVVRIKAGVAARGFCHSTMRMSADEIDRPGLPTIDQLIAQSVGRELQNA
jgi:4-hydroxy-tetrahydrodipicolinate synthase